MTAELAPDRVRQASTWRELIMRTAIVIGAGTLGTVLLARRHPADALFCGAVVWLSVAWAITLDRWATPCDCPVQPLPDPIVREVVLVRGPAQIITPRQWGQRLEGHTHGKVIAIGTTAHVGYARQQANIAPTKLMVVTASNLHALKGVERGRHVYAVGPWWDAMPPERYHELIDTLTARGLRITWVAT